SRPATDRGQPAEMRALGPWPERHAHAMPSPRLQDDSSGRRGQQSKTRRCDHANSQEPQLCPPRLDSGYGKPYRLPSGDPHAWTETQEGAVAAGRSAGMAGAAAMAQQVEVKLELLAAGRDREHRVVKLLEGGAGAEQGQASAHPGGVGGDG